MPTIRNKTDASQQAIADALSKYETQHPDADVVIYRHGSVSVRIRIVDPDFEGMSKADRHDLVWSFL